MRLLFRKHFTPTEKRHEVAAMADLSAKERKNLPAEDFAYVDSKGGKHLPLVDAEHVRGDAARFDQTEFESETAKRAAWNKIVAAAKKFGVELSETLGADGKLHPKSENAAMLSTHAVAIEALENATPPEWVELLPAGRFIGKDGRGPFFNEAPQQVIAATLAMGMDAGLPIDLDHATDFAAPEGRPAPAVGWIREFQVRSGAIWGRVEWNADGSKAIQSRQYRYISPVFQFVGGPNEDKKAQAGIITRILRASLTNNPNLNLTAVAAAKIGLSHSAASEEPDMADDTGNKKLSQVVASLEKIFPDLPPAKLMELAAQAMDFATDGDEDDDADGGTDGASADAAGDADGDADGNASESPEEMSARQASELDAAPTPVARAEMAKKHAKEKEAMSKRTASAAHAQQPAPIDASKFVAVADYQKVVTEFNSMKAERRREKAETAVMAAMREGRIIAAQKDWALAYCAADPAGFATFAAKQPKMLQDEGGTFRSLPESGAGASLNRAETAVCAALGLTAEEFTKSKAARTSTSATVA